MSDTRLTIEVVAGSVVQFAADVLALKYPQGYYGSEASVFNFLRGNGLVAENDLKPSPGSYVWVDRKLPLVPNVLFLGVPPLEMFGYNEIEKWAQDVVTITDRERPEARHLAITIHGPGYGLDEVEALYAEIRGILKAVDECEADAGITRVSVVELSAARAQLLQIALNQIGSAPTGGLGQIAFQKRRSEASWRRPSVPSTGPSSPISAPPRGQMPETTAPQPHAVTFSIPLQETGLSSIEQVEQKPRAFVAMPFATEMEDVFYYGIQTPVRNLGYICERIDQEAFTGDILDQVKTRIDNAEIVIADLTGANPNVYLEVGYAWGKARPTVLVANKKDDLKFDVRGQRCLRYQSIKDLEKLLMGELKNLGTNRKAR